MKNRLTHWSRPHYRSTTHLPKTWINLSSGLNADMLGNQMNNRRADAVLSSHGKRRQPVCGGVDSAKKLDWRT